jgi:hypothetical protein
MKSFILERSLERREVKRDYKSINFLHSALLPGLLEIIPEYKNLDFLLYYGIIFLI